MAIVGMSCRLPGGVNSPDELWELLKNKKDSISEIPSDRWNPENYFHKEQSGKSYSKWGGFIDSINTFDPSFFGISPREALGMDPQQRLLLELAWEAMEDSGTLPKDLENSNTGVYVGISSHDYCDLQTAHEAQSSIDAYTQTGNCNSIAANRISYIFNFKGPSLAIDTACSSSLVALDSAVKDLTLGVCDTALVAGVQVLLRPEVFTGFSMASMLSPTGRCHSFSNDADGFVRAEGGGVVLLKPLEKAIADGDTIHAVVCASGTNQDGKTKGMTVPSQDSQMKLIEETCARAGIEPHLVQYVEAHGTGTKVGDPIEANSIGTVIGKKRTSNRISNCIMGSIKSNVGHLEPASGMAGLLKTVVALKHAEIPANIHAEQLNEDIDFAGLGLTVPTEHMMWPENEDGKPRYAGINSFGFGGANAHVIVSEAPAVASTKAQSDSVNQKVLTISSQSSQALRLNAIAYRDALESMSNEESASISLADIAYSANCKKTHHKERIAVIGSSIEEWCENLSQYIDNEAVDSVVESKETSKPHPIVYVFSGMGQQWAGMAKGLLESEPVFAQMIARCDKELSKYVEWSLSEELLKDTEYTLVDKTYIAQPLIFSIQVSLSALLESWGILPNKIVGHSVGEVAAAYVSGVLTFEDAIQVIYHRSRLQNKAAGTGSMLALGISETEVNDYLLSEYTGVSIAAINSSSSVTLAGDTDQLTLIAEAAQSNDVFNRFLKVDVPYHSPGMDPYMEELTIALEELDPNAARVELYSTVLGSQITGFEMDGDYWADNMREPVLFKKSIEEMAHDGAATFLEISAHPVLMTSLKEILSESTFEHCIERSLYRNKDNTHQVQLMISTLYVMGYSLDWKLITGEGSFINLPRYQFNREVYWKEPEIINTKRIQKNIRPLLGYKEHTNWIEFAFDINSHSVPWLPHHKIQEKTVVPAAAYIETILESMSESISDKNDTQSFALNNVAFNRTLTIDTVVPKKVKIVLLEDPQSFEIMSATSGEEEKWTTHSVGSYEYMSRAHSLDSISHESILKRCTTSVDVNEIYNEFDLMGLGYTDHFKSIKALWSGANESIAKLSLPGDAQQGSGYVLHPALLDGAFQSLIACIPKSSSGRSQSLLPVFLEKIRVYPKNIGNMMYCNGSIVTTSPKGYTGDIVLFNEHNVIVAEIIGLRLHAVENIQSHESTKNIDAFEYVWQSINGQESIDGSTDTCTDIFSRFKYEKSQYGARFNRDTYYSDVSTVLNELSLGFMYRALCRIGLSKIDEIDVEGHSLINHLSPHVESLLNRCLTLLEERGYLEKNSEEGVYRLINELDVSTLNAQWNSALEKYPSYLAELTLIAHCGDTLGCIFNDTIDPVKSMFPQMSNSLEHLYQDSPSSKVYNQITRQAILEMVAQYPKEKKIRILEIGAGSGGFTSSIIDALPQERTEYHFTDVSEDLLNEAKLKFHDKGCISFSLLDIEREISEDNNEKQLGIYDIIISYDILHATQNISSTISHIKQLMNPSAALFLIELTEKEPWLDLVFGTLPGWWRFNDQRVESNHPLLSEDEWNDLLKAEGFHSVVSFNDDVIGNKGFQSVICAQGVPVALTEKQSNSESEKIVITGSCICISDSGEQHSTLITAIESQYDSVIIIDSKKYVDASISDQLSEHLLNTTDCSDVIYLVSNDIENDQYFATQKIQLLTLLDCIKSISSSAIEQPSLRVVTRGVWKVAEDSSCNPMHAGLWGLCRVAMNEYSGQHISLVDLSEKIAPEEIEQFLTLLQNGSGEDEIAIRGTAQYQHRIKKVAKTAVAIASSAPFTMGIDKVGSIDNVVFNQVAREKPYDTEVEIEVKAVALNFKDIAKTIGLLSEDTMMGTASGFNLGLECAGVVTSVGMDVTDYSVGDHVIALLPRKGIGKYSLCNAKQVYRKPNNITFEEAVTIPVVYFTAYYALNKLAQLEEGESVLIHAGAGGVGLAAIKIALQKKCIVYATAGSPVKRDLLRALGVHVVLDSRSTEFSDEIIKHTNGTGVDVVLNSLPGDIMLKSIECMASFGRFVEIGKKDIEQNKVLFLKAFQNNLSYFALDTDRLVVEKPEVSSREMNRLLDLIESSHYSALPHRTFDFANMKRAMKYISQAKHIGKVVVSLNENDTVALDSKIPALDIGDNETYIVAGGVGGFGFSTAEWLAHNGAKTIVLLGRSGKVNENTQQKIDSLQSQGVAIVVKQVDISKMSEVTECINQLAASLPPIKGVFITAMVLKDGPLKESTHEDFTAVLEPKMAGSWNFHKATLGLELKFFVMYSSITTTVGNANQGNYVAANMYLEQLAEYRQSIHLPGTTIGWGAIGDVGHVSEHQEIKDYLSTIGLRSIEPQSGLNEMGIALTENDCAVRYVGSVDWEAWSRSKTGVYSNRYEFLMKKGNQSSEEGESVFDLDSLLSIGSIDDIKDCLNEKIWKIIGLVLRISDTEIDKDSTLIDLGIDSLMVVELSALIDEEFSVQIPTMHLFADITIPNLTNILMEKLNIVPSETSEVGDSEKIVMSSES